MKTPRRACLSALLLGLCLITAPPAPAQSQGDTAVSVGGFVDVYYAYSFQQHPNRDRSYTTQPLRHNEFNLNLGVVDVKYQASAVRGRLALQTGTYVESNLAAEPELLKHVLEASVGTRLAEGLWVDMGIFPSHIGFEGILSKDNWNYSRSLLADYSPYYETGIGVTGTLSDRLTLRVLVLNGWQNINETNNDKAAGTQLQYKLGEDLLLNWSSFIGNEQPDSAASQLRIFNDLYGVWTLSPAWSLAVAFDIGIQRNGSGLAWDAWHGSSLMLRHQLSTQWAIVARVEYYNDPTGVIAPTRTPHGFLTGSGSLNVDYAPAGNLMWRIETRIFGSRDAVYPTGDGLRPVDGFIVLSAALSM